MLRSVCTLKRQTSVKDTSGGPTQTFAPVVGATGVACDVQPASTDVRLRFAEMSMVVTSTIFLARDIGARASDRLDVVQGNHTRSFLVVEGGYMAGAQGYWEWPAVCHAEEVPTGA